ncbi:MAG: aldo/keto reductase [Pseudomonadota bacterium]
MERRTLGRSGLKVSVLGLGTGQFGSFGQTRRADCVRMAHAAFDGGINLIDTADFYSFGEAETITGAAIEGRRDKVIVASKFGMPMSDDVNERGGSRRWIMASVEASLKRLGTDYIDIYQLHAPDYDTDLEETLGAMSDLVRAGKIRYFGTSNSTGMRIAEAALKARLAGLIAPHAEQQSYSMFVRAPEAEVLPAAQAYGAGVLAYSPLDGGWLSGKYRKGKRVEKSPRHRLQPEKFDTATETNLRRLEKVEALASVADEAGIDLPRMAVGFVLAHPAVSTALIGGTRLHHIEHHLNGVATLSDDVLDRIDEIAPPGESLMPGGHAFSELQDKTLRRRRTDTTSATPTAGVDYIRRTVTEEQPG